MMMNDYWYFLLPSAIIFMPTFIFLSYFIVDSLIFFSILQMSMLLGPSYLSYPLCILQGNVQIPKNGMEFARDWRRLYKTNEDRYNFVVQLGGNRLKEIFRAEISNGLLGDILCALNVCFKEKDTQEITNILDCLSKVNRFSLSLQFLGANEVQCCKDLITKTEQFISSDVLDKIKIQYGL